MEGGTSTGADSISGAAMMGGGMIAGGRFSIGSGLAEILKLFLC